MSKKLFVICRREIKAAEEKKEMNFNVKVNNVSVEVRVMKLELSHLMRELSYPSFIGEI